MRVIECPAEYVPDITSPSIFLGGGITGCPDWQSDMIQRFDDLDYGTLVNPRRAFFDVADPEATPVQIEWEFRHLQLVDAIMFWFPCETLCPIALFELGAAATRQAKIFVGCHPEYARRIDVEHQLRLLRPDVTVSLSLDGVELSVRRWLLHDLLRGVKWTQ